MKIHLSCRIKYYQLIRNQLKRKRKENSLSPFFLLFFLHFLPLFVRKSEFLQLEENSTLVTLN